MCIELMYIKKNLMYIEKKRHPMRYLSILSLGKFMGLPTPSDCIFYVSYNLSIVVIHIIDK